MLLPAAGSVAEADARLAPRLELPVLERVTGLVPDAWLAPGEREAYVEYLARRLESPRGFAREAEAARAGS